MRITIFGRERQTKEGKKFPTFTSRLIDNTTGEEILVTVKFPSTVAPPSLDSCPCNICIPEGGASYQEKILDKVDKDGFPIFDEVTGEKETIISRTVWVRKWKFSATPYVDTSMSRFATDEEDF